MPCSLVDGLGVLEPLFFMLNPAMRACDDAGAERFVCADAIARPVAVLLRNHWRTESEHQTFRFLLPKRRDIGRM